MLDQGATIKHQRATGRADVAVSHRRGASRLDRLYQSGSAKAMLPRVHGDVPEVVFLNTAGGLTGGDELGYRLEVGRGASAVATTQAAERVYDCAGTAARVIADFAVAAGGRLDWLPQETILYGGAALDRTTRIDLAGDGACVALEVLVLGRQAMGERITRVAVTDRREIRRNGRPVLVEPLQLDATGLAPRAALLRGAQAVASLALVAPGAEDAAGALDDLNVEGVEAGASGWDGRLTLRAFAAESMPLHRYLVAVLQRVRNRRAPLVWQP